MSDKKVDEINLKDLSKKIAQSSGNKNLHKAMKKSKDKTTSDLAAMRKRLDALKAGYAAESVELEEGVIDQVKDIVAKKQAKKISGVMVDMFTASAISQIYDKVNDANKAKMDKLPITKLADVAMKMMKRESAELDEAKIISTKPHPGGGHIVKMKTDGGQTVTRHLKSGKVKTMKVHKESVELEEARWEYDASTYMVGGNLRYDDKLEYKLSKANAAILNKYMKQAKSDAERSKVWSMFWDSKETGNKPKGPEKAIAYAKNAVNEEKIDEVLDTPKAMQSYLNKNKASADRAASSAAAKILRGKDKDGNRADHSPEVKTRDKRAKGAKLANRNATRKTFNRLRNEMTEGRMKDIAMDIDNVTSAMKMNKTMKPFADKFKKDAMRTLNIRKSLEKILPDYVSGKDITKVAMAAESVQEASLKKGDTVIPNKGPHKGHPHTIIHDFGDGHYNISPDNLTARQIKYSLGAARAKASDLKLHKEEVQEASKEGTIRIIDLGRMGKGKGFQVQRMTKGKFVDQGKPYKSQKDAEKVRKDGQHSMQFEAAPKVDPAKFAAHMARHDKPKKMTSTQKSLADIRKKSESFEPHMMYDPKTGKGYKAEKEADHLRMKKMGYVHDKPEVNEKYKLHHKTMSAALQHAYDEVKKKGYEIDKDDIDNKVAFGPKKPSSGKTNSYSLGLSKNGKPVKQKLHIQVYNMDNKGYELNMYVS